MSTLGAAWRSPNGQIGSFLTLTSRPNGFESVLPGLFDANSAKNPRKSDGISCGFCSPREKSQGTFQTPDLIRASLKYNARLTPHPTEPEVLPPSPPRGKIYKAAVFRKAFGLRALELPLWGEKVFQGNNLSQSPRAARQPFTSSLYATELPTEMSHKPLNSIISLNVVKNAPSLTKRAFFVITALL